MGIELSRKEFFTLVKGMKAVYTQPTFLPDNDSIEVWYQLLNDIPYPSLNIAIQSYMKINESSFPPSPAALRKYATRGGDTGDESRVMEEWALVRKGLRNSIYNYEEEFAKLPALAQKAVGSPFTMREWAQLEESELSTVIQGNFIRTWKMVRQRADEDNRLSPDVATLIENTLAKNKLLTGEGDNENALTNIRR